MWILTFLPEWIFHTILFLGIVITLIGIMLNSIPIINQYKFTIQLIGIIFLVFGLYTEGGLVEKQAWEFKVKTLEAQLAEAKAKSAIINIEVVKKLLTNRTVIKEKGETIIKYVDREVTKYDNTCPLPQSTIVALNAAAKNEILNDDDKVDSKPINEAATKSIMKLPKK